MRIVLFRWFGCTKARHVASLPLLSLAREHGRDPQLWRSQTLEAVSFTREGDMPLP